MSRQSEDLYDTSPYQTAFHRIRAEYVEMPGMRLTAAQVERLSGVDATTCRVVLDDLVRAKFLHAGSDGTYARRADDTAVQTRPSRDRVERAERAAG
jgi:hypothetical protein